jgi:diadenosine tetraphosphate (Ap4A) HIT family hydrolase
MAILSSLYDTRDTGYPLFYSGVLTFAITTCLPLNLGISKLPAFAAFAIFAAGFVSLFMLARNPQVGLDLLAHIHVSPKRKDPVLVKPTVQNTHAPSPKLQLEVPPQDPFPYLQNMISSIVSNNQFTEMDPETKTRLVNILQRLQTVSKDISKTQKN